MGCCCSEPEPDDLPHDHTRSHPLQPNPSLHASPQKLVEPDNAEALRLQGSYPCK
jgi:hypothetical protein